jgi:hypothetical protein
MLATATASSRDLAETSPRKGNDLRRRSRGSIDVIPALLRVRANPHILYLPFAARLLIVQLEIA